MSHVENDFYIIKLKEEFSRRQRSNSYYSLRAFARQLEIHPSTLSQILKGNRPLPWKNTQRVLEAIPLDVKERTRFIESLEKKHGLLDRIKTTESEERFILDEAYFQIIAEWEHYAVLTLFDCEDFNPNIESVSTRLGISKVRAEVVLDNLLRYGLLSKSNEGVLTKAHPRVRTTEDVTSQALRASHRDTLELGKVKLEEVALEARDFSSLMVAVDSEKLPEAKSIIREFRLKMLELLKSGNRSEVYQLAIQFYPVTKPLTTHKPKLKSVSKGKK